MYVVRLDDEPDCPLLDCGSLGALKFLTINNIEVSSETIIWSVRGGHEQMINFLWEQGHSFDRQLWEAVRWHHNKVAFWLMENFECDEIRLPICVWLFNTEMFLFFLLEQKRNINETIGLGRTSLMLAATNNNVPLAEFILSLEAADAGAKDRR